MITASKFKRVVSLRESTLPFNCVKEILCNNRNKTLSPAPIQWGIKNEKKAKDIYISISKRKHVNFSFKECGLFVDKKFRFIGASPDGIAECKCCGIRCVEIKCPYTARYSYPKLAALSTGHNKNQDGSLFIDKNHSHYYQMIGQMGVTEIYKCDFVVYTTKGIYVHIIDFDQEYWENLLNILSKFYELNVLPEILFNLP